MGYWRITSIFTALVFIVTPSASVADDLIADQLVLDKAQYEATLADSVQKLRGVYRELLGKRVDSSAADTNLLSAQIKAFDELGILDGPPEMSKAFLEYGGAKFAAATKLKEAFIVARKGYLAAAKEKLADDLQEELQKLQLPQKLASIQWIRSNQFVIHRDYLGFVKTTQTDSDKLNATWEVVSGLADSRYVSIRSANLPQHYLAHGNNRIRVQPYEESGSFRENATFKKASSAESVGRFRLGKCAEAVIQSGGDKRGHSTYL